MPATQTALVLIHSHGVDASIWDSVYAELVSVASVIKSDFSRLNGHTTIKAYALYAQLESVAVDQVILAARALSVIHCL